MLKYYVIIMRSKTRIKKVGKNSKSRKDKSRKGKSRKIRNPKNKSRKGGMLSMMGFTVSDEKYKTTFKEFEKKMTDYNAIVVPILTSGTVDAFVKSFTTLHKGCDIYLSVAYKKLKSFKEKPTNQMNPNYPSRPLRPVYLKRNSTNQLQLPNKIIAQDVHNMIQYVIFMKKYMFDECVDVKLATFSSRLAITKEDKGDELVEKQKYNEEASIIYDTLSSALIELGLNIPSLPTRLEKARNKMKKEAEAEAQAQAQEKPQEKPQEKTNTGPTLALAAVQGPLTVVPPGAAPAAG